MKVYRIRQRAFAGPQGDEAFMQIAHDLRSPMSCVSGAAQTALLNSRQGRDVDEQLRQILLAVQTMDRMLDGLCEMQRGAYTPAQLRAALETLLVHAAKKEQRVTMDFDGLAPCRHLQGGAALERVMLNILSNAIKYTPRGGEIRVTGELAPGWMILRVEDNGMGMKPEFLRQAFAPFARAQQSAHLPGKGLGLSIVRSLVHRLGGRVSVKSVWGKGSCFTVRVPYEESEKLN